jgi:hypothetical protein
VKSLLPFQMTARGIALALLGVGGEAAAARELRDRYLEQMNAGLLLPPAAQGKYDVSRALERRLDAADAESPDAIRLLDAA